MQATWYASNNASAWARGGRVMYAPLCSCTRHAQTLRPPIMIVMGASSVLPFPQKKSNKSRWGMHAPLQVLAVGVGAEDEHRLAAALAQHQRLRLARPAADCQPLDAALRRLLQCNTLDIVKGTKRLLGCNSKLLGWQVHLPWQAVGQYRQMADRACAPGVSHIVAGGRRCV